VIVHHLYFKVSFNLFYYHVFPILAMPILSHQPFKGLITLLFTVAAPPYLLGLSLWYLLPRNRPLSTWSWRMSIASAYLINFFRWRTTIHLAPRYSTSKLILGERHVTVKPRPDEIYTQVLSQYEAVKPADVHAAWFPKRPSKEELVEGIVVLLFQGGGFVTATDPGKTGVMPAHLFAEHLTSGRPVYGLWAQYRLARSEESRFPAALQDAVTFYNYLLDQGVPAENIIVSGESAGGNLVIGLMRYIDETRKLHAPRGALAWSPWVDISEPSLRE
jgi:acetyl esterase/lipase